MWKAVLLVLALLVSTTSAVTRAEVMALEKKKPQRDEQAIREATKISMSGYAGKSTTKGVQHKPTVTRADVVAAVTFKGEKPQCDEAAVREATVCQEGH